MASHEPGHGPLQLRDLRQHSAGDLPLYVLHDDGDHIYFNVVSVIFGDRFWIEGYLRKCFFHGEIKELLLKNNSRRENFVNECTITKIPFLHYIVVHLPKKYESSPFSEMIQFTMNPDQYFIRHISSETYVKSTLCNSSTKKSFYNMVR